MTNLMHALMNEIGMSTVIESSVMQIKSSLLYNQATQKDRPIFAYLKKP